MSDPRHCRDASDHPDAGRGKAGRLVESLTSGTATDRNDLQRRADASASLATLAVDDPASVDDYLPVLTEELRRETGREPLGDDRDTRAVSRAVRNHLVRTVATVIVERPDRPLKREVFRDFVGAVTTTLDDETLRPAARALFDRADQRSAVLIEFDELLSELLAYPDDVVRAWTAGAVGHVAANHPDAIAGTAPGLRALLTHSEPMVQHNALEALATLVRERPEHVAPAGEDVRTLLTHEEVAIQYNAAGVLGRLADDHPDVVVPAVDELLTLSEHPDEAIRRIATGTLVRLAHIRPDAIAARRTDEP